MAPRKGRLARKPRARVVRRKGFRSVMRRAVKQYLRIKETYDAGTFVANTGYAVGVRIDQLPQIASYQNLYGKYRITGALYRFVPNTGNSEVNQVMANIAAGNAYAGIARMSYTIAKGNMSAPVNEAGIITQAHKMKMLGNKGFSVFVKNPVFAVDANAGGATTESKWTTGTLGLNQSADLVHQGLEFIAVNQGTANISYKLYITVYAILTESI